jgi:hypothetical protein
MLGSGLQYEHLQLANSWRSRYRWPTVNPWCVLPHIARTEYQTIENIPSHDLTPLSELYPPAYPSRLQLVQRRPVGAL